MLVKLTLGVIFNNIFTSSFYVVDPKSVKKASQVISHFALLGSACVKDASKMLTKLTPGTRRGIRAALVCIELSKSMKYQLKTLKIAADRWLRRVPSILKNVNEGENVIFERKEKLCVCF